jgi:hypothetical protein
MKEKQIDNLINLFCKWIYILSVIACALKGAIGWWTAAFFLTYTFILRIPNR